MDSGRTAPLLVAMLLLLPGATASGAEACPGAEHGSVGATLCAGAGAVTLQAGFTWAFTDNGTVWAHFAANDSSAASWSWDFGDGGTGTGPAPVHAYAAGNFTVTLRVEDDLGRSEESTRSVEAPDPNGAPVLDPIGFRNLTVGALFTLHLMASDPDGDPLSYDADDLPSGATFDAGNGTFAWSPAAAGVHNVTFRVSDGSLSDNETVSLHVRAADDGAGGGSGGTGGGGTDGDGQGGTGGGTGGAGGAGATVSGGGPAGGAAGASAGGSEGGSGGPGGSGGARSADADGDGAPDLHDLCPHTPDPDQADLDGDGVGDACDKDRDGDGIPDARDVCPRHADPEQADADGDGTGDACRPPRGLEATGNASGDTKSEADVLQKDGREEDGEGGDAAATDPGADEAEAAPARGPGGRLQDTPERPPSMGPVWLLAVLWVALAMAAVLMVAGVVARHRR